MKRIFALGLVILMVLAMVACKKTEAPVAEAPSNAPVQDAPAVEPVVEEPNEKKGGTLVIGSLYDATSLAHWIMRGPSDMLFLSAVYESLFVFDENGDVQPFLAESLTPDVEALTYTIKLKEGILFHDGSELTAEVAKWNLELYKEKGVFGASYLGKVDHIDAVDEYTVVLQMSEWDPFLPESLARSSGASFMISKLAYDTYGEEFVSSNPVTTAPFKFESWEHDVAINLTRFDDYWQGEPLLDGIKIEVYSEALVAQAAISAGDIDIFYNVSDTEMAKYLANEGFTMQLTSLPTRAYVVGYDCVKEDDPLTNVLVRKAVSYAINSEELVNALFEGVGKVAYQLGAEGSTYYSENIEKYEYNPEKAKELLAEAGYPNGFTTRITTTAGSLSNAAQIIMEQLRQVNINVELNLVDLAGFMSAMDGWNGGMFASFWGLESGTANQIASNCAQGLGSGFGRTSILHPDDVNALIHQANESSGDEMIRLYKQAHELIFNEHCIMKVYGLIPNISVVSPKVMDSEFGQVVFASNTYWKTWLAE